jgi:hypothetical protein
MRAAKARQEGRPVYRIVHLQHDFLIKVVFGRAVFMRGESNVFADVWDLVQEWYSIEDASGFAAEHRDVLAGCFLVCRRPNGEWKAVE